MSKKRKYPPPPRVYGTVHECPNSPFGKQAQWEIRLLYHEVKLTGTKVKLTVETVKELQYTFAELP